MAQTVSTRRVPTVVLALVAPLVAALAVVITLVATSPMSVSGAGGGTSVTIQNFAFTPPTLHVAAGSTITVRNADDTKHTVTAVDGSFDTGPLAGGEQTTVTIARPGTYRYYCDIHNYMTGTIEAS